MRRACTDLPLIDNIGDPVYAGIAFVTVIAWIPGHAASYLGAASSVPGEHPRAQGRPLLIFIHPRLALVNIL